MIVGSQPDDGVAIASRPDGVGIRFVQPTAMRLDLPTLSGVIEVVLGPTYLVFDVVVSRPVATVILKKRGGREIAGRRARQAPTARCRVRPLTLCILLTPDVWVE